MTLPKSISEDSDLLSTTDVAKKLGVHRSTVHHWIKEGMLPSEKHGNFHAIAPKELKRFLTMYDIELEPSKPSKRKKSNGKKRGTK